MFVALAATAQQLAELVAEFLVEPLLDLLFRRLPRFEVELLGELVLQGASCALLERVLECQLVARREQVAADFDRDRQALELLQSFAALALARLDDRRLGQKADRLLGQIDLAAAGEAERRARRGQVFGPEHAVDDGRRCADGREVRLQRSGLRGRRLAGEHRLALAQDLPQVETLDRAVLGFHRDAAAERAAQFTDGRAATGQVHVDVSQSAHVVLSQQVAEKRGGIERIELGLDGERRRTGIAVAIAQVQVAAVELRRQFLRLGGLAAAAEREPHIGELQAVDGQLADVHSAVGVERFERLGGQFDAVDVARVLVFAAGALVRCLGGQVAVGIDGVDAQRQLQGLGGEIGDRDAALHRGVVELEGQLVERRAAEAAAVARVETRAAQHLVVGRLQLDAERVEQRAWRERCDRDRPGEARALAAEAFAANLRGDDDACRLDATIVEGQRALALVEKRLPGQPKRLRAAGNRGAAGLRLELQLACFEAHRAGIRQNAAAQRDVNIDVLSAHRLLCARLDRGVDRVEQDGLCVGIARHRRADPDLHRRLRLLRVGDEIGFEVDRFVRHQGAGLEVEGFEPIALLRLRVAVADDGVADRHALHVDQFELHAAIGGRLGRRRLFVGRVLLAFQQVLPVGPAVGIDGQIQAQAVERHAADLDLAIGQQRHQLHADTQLPDVGERLVAESLGVAERGVVDRDAQPREDAQLDVADLEAAPGLFLDSLGDLPAEAVGVEQQRQRHRRDDEQQEQSAEDEQYDLERLGHDPDRR